ncbi:caspase family protein [Rhodopirellula sp. JC639]|uniref:caspase family protein n=1 Tax=Stieleria mannarensis TaxID=2755585 RepID=UPI0016014553|nr:caspase family protein [Rhodopirellula sp. JC639]
MAKANQRAGWRKSNKRVVAATTTEFGHRGRESRKLLFRVSMLSTLGILLLALLVYMLRRSPDRDVPLIVSVVSQSGARANNSALFTAPNPFALEDVELLWSWFGGGANAPSENVVVVGDPNDASGVMGYETDRLISAITKPLATVQPGGPDGNMIAIYLSAHGFVDKGTPYLAVGDSRADSEQTWIRFQDLFDAIVGTLDERGGDSKDVKTVLFIDAARVGSQWDWGQFSESFSEACERVTGGVPDRIAVVLSASPGQRSWWDPRKGRGLFTQALVEALTGQGDLDGDNTVTVGEIAEYLKRQVNEYAKATWDATQTPMIVGRQAADWNFISQPGPQPPPPETGVDVDRLRSDFAELDTLWQRHNRLTRMTHPPLAFNPLGWATLEKKLARLDALLLAGKGYRDRFVTIRSGCESDLTQFEIGPDTMPEPSSLPELALRDYFRGPELERAGWSKDEGAAFEEMVANWRKKPDIAAAVQVPMNEAQAIRFLLPWIEEKKYAAESLSLSSQLLDRANLVTGVQPASLLESQLMRLCAAPDLQHLEPQTIATLFECQNLSRQTLCSDDLRASFWIRSRLADLQQQRLACVDRMLSRNTGEQTLGRSRWAEVRVGFESLKQSAAEISQAYQLRDQMLHSIPRIAETLMVDMAAFDYQEQFPDSQTRAIVGRAIDALAALVSRLQLPQDDDNQPIQSREPQITAARLEAQKAFDALTGRIIDRLNLATKEKAGDAKGLRQNFALLAGSGTDSAELRQRVHTRLCDLIADESAGAGIVQNNQPHQPAADATTAALELMAIGRKHVWDHWLSVTRDPALLGAVAATTDATDATPPNLVALFQDTGAAFRKLVAELVGGRLAERTLADDVIDDPIKRSEQKASLETTRRQIEQWDTYLRGRTILFSYAPAEVEKIGKGRFAIDQQLFLFDHAARTIDEFWCGAREGDEPFFVAAGNRLLQSRNQNPLFPTIKMNLDGVDLSERLAAAGTAATARTSLQPQPAEEFRVGTLLKFVIGKQVQFVLDRPASVPAGFASVWSPLGDQSKTVALNPSADGSVSVPMTVPSDTPAEEASLVTDVFFRGLRRSGRIAFKTLTGGTRTVFRLPNYAEPAARVIRQQKEPERLLLVMDCSRSMGITTNVGLSRLEVAKNAVTGFLNGLAPDVEVGLILFGDQFGFKESVVNPMTGKRSRDGLPKIWPVEVNGQFKFRIEQLVQGQIVDAGHVAGNENVANNPNLDVRVAAPIKPLDQRHLGDLRGKISGLGAIGTTPTYRAIAEAYKQLARRGGHIIVLTDGLPTVVHTENVNVDDLSDQAQTLYIKNKDNIKLTFVRYLIGAKQLEDEFRGAKFLNAADGKALLRHLQNIRRKPEVVWERNRNEASVKADFDSIVSISQWPPTGVATPSGHPVLPAQPFSIRAIVPDSSDPIDERTDVRVEGGEQFELILADKQLSHQPFNFQFTPLNKISTQLTDSSRFQVRAGPMGKRVDRQLTLQVALESANGDRGNGKFTPRPSDIWIELTGIDSRAAARGRNETYSFSLPEFLERQPIPILLCRIDDFDARFDQVAVKAWMRFGDQRLAGIPIPLDQPGRITLDELPGVSFRTQRGVNPAGGIRVTVTEQYTQEREPNTIRVLPTPLCDEASTVVYRDKRVVTRTFDFADADTSVSLSVVAAGEIQKQSTLAATGSVPIDFDSR